MDPPVVAPPSPSPSPSPPPSLPPSPPPSLPPSPYHHHHHPSPYNSDGNCLGAYTYDVASASTSPFPHTPPITNTNCILHSPSPSFPITFSHSLLDDHCCWDQGFDHHLLDLLLDNLAGHAPNYDIHPLAADDHDEHEENEIQSELPTTAVEERHVVEVINQAQAPEYGMEFSSEEEAYEFYKNYAQQNGFAVRKGKVLRSPNGTIRKRFLLCSREGFKSTDNTTKYKRKSTRTGCKANVQLTLQDAKWVISDLLLDHNHDVGRPPTPSSVKDSHRHPPSTMHKQPVGNNISAAKYTRLHGHDQTDSNNYLHHRNMNLLQPEDVQGLIDYFKHLQVEDSTFFYTIQVDSENHLTNFFWRDGRSRIDYDYFGDVLVFDTAFQVERYNMICAPFWGLNHHQQCILFGCAFLFDQTMDSFVWLFKTFIEAMGNRRPKTFYTDESQAIASALEVVFPETEHHLGMCYIYENAKRHLSTYYEQPDFERNFNRCIFECRSKQEFELQWNLLLDKFNLRENSWLNRLFMLHEKWSHLFGKKTFTAGVQSILNSINVNIVFQNSASDFMTLPSFIHQYDKEADKRRLEETIEDLRCNKRVPLISIKEIEKQAEGIYTGTMFRKFQDEFLYSMQLEMEEVTSFGTVSVFKLTEEGHKKGEVVTFDCLGPSITCSCAKFESIGILCSHSLKVLEERNISYIPSEYLLKRWTKSAKDGVVMEDRREEMAGKSNRRSSLYSRNLMHKALHLITKSAAIAETRQITEHCLDATLKKVEYVLKTKGVEHMNTTSSKVDCEDDRDGIDSGCYRKRKKIGSNSSCINQKEGTKKKK